MVSVVALAFALTLDGIGSRGDVDPGRERIPVSAWATYPAYGIAFVLVAAVPGGHVRSGARSSLAIKVRMRWPAMSKMRTVVGAAAEGERNVHCCGEAPPRPPALLPLRPPATALTATTP